MKKQNEKAAVPTLDIPTLTSSHVAQMIGMTSTIVCRMAKDGRFPKPVSMTASKRPVLRWYQRDVEAWLKDRKVRSGYEPYRPTYLEETGSAQA